MSVLKIYVLQLENEKWFLHISTGPTHEIVMIECETLYDYVKINKPIKVYETLQLFDAFDINTWTKRYMSYFGIDNVRGGIYSNEKIPDYLIQSIEHELSTTIQDYDEKISIFNTIRNKENASTLDFQNQINQYNELLNTGYKSFTRDFFDQIDWIKSMVESSQEKIVKKKTGIFKNTSEDIKIYQKFIDNIDVLNNYYYKLDEDLIRVESSVLLKQPRFVFDKLFYHPDSIQRWEDEIETAFTIIKKYEFMGYTLINYIDCMEFDFINRSSN